MFCIKLCFLEPEPVGAELLWVEPEPKKNIWSRSRGKWFGSATLDYRRFFSLMKTILFKPIPSYKKACYGCLTLELYKVS